MSSVIFPFSVDPLPVRQMKPVLRAINAFVLILVVTACAPVATAIPTPTPTPTSTQTPSPSPSPESTLTPEPTAIPRPGIDTPVYIGDRTPSTDGWLLFTDAWTAQSYYNPKIIHYSFGTEPVYDRQYVREGIGQTWFVMEGTYTGSLYWNFGYDAGSEALKTMQKDLLLYVQGPTGQRSTGFFMGWSSNESGTKYFALLIIINTSLKGPYVLHDDYHHWQVDLTPIFHDPPQACVPAVTPSATPAQGSPQTPSPLSSAQPAKVLRPGIDTFVDVGYGASLKFNNVVVTDHYYNPAIVDHHFDVKEGSGQTWLILEGRYRGDINIAFGPAAMSGKPKESGPAIADQVGEIESPQYFWSSGDRFGGRFAMSVTINKSDNGPYKVADSCDGWQVDLSSLPIELATPAP